MNKLERGMAIAIVVATGGCHRASNESLATTHPSEPPVSASAKAAPHETLAEVRRGFKTTLKASKSLHLPPLDPPPATFRLERYHSDVGELPLYVTPNPADGKRHPAMVWLVGGFSNSIGPMWEREPEDNEQTASAFRDAGIVMLYPSLRGGNDNPGQRESFYGEVDDVIAASKYLASLDYVDPSRIYLGGHSTGGTLALLVAESTDMFRCVFSFGPVGSPTVYGQEYLFYDASDKRETKVRAPGLFMSTIRTPTFVIEGGARGEGNSDQIPILRKATRDAPVRYFIVPNQTHFTVLAPLERVLAAKIVADTGASSAITLTDTEITSAFAH